jgi:hypothetical protein
MLEFVTSLAKRDQVFFRIVVQRSLIETSGGVSAAEPMEQLHKQFRSCSGTPEPDLHSQAFSVDH